MRNTEYLITLPERGIKVLAPSETAHTMQLARQAKESGETLSKESVIWSDNERLRLNLLKTCPQLKNRFPTAEDGKQYMETVDYAHYELLVGYADRMSGHIANAWNEINTREPIASILYGSVARGMVKAPTAPQPSDIDLTIIGNISEGNRARLFEAIHDERVRINDEIRLSLPITNDVIQQKRFIGLKIQDIHKLRKNNYDATINYIQSGSVALLDPSGIWNQLEQEAFEAIRDTSKRNTVLTSDPLGVFELDVHKAARTAPDLM